VEPIVVFADGACSGNPGPAGIGIVLVSGPHRKEISEYIGEGTNNIAEIMAVMRGLELIKDRARPVVVKTDSSYTIGVLSKNWKAKANKELIAQARAVVALFATLRFEWVPGHAGVAENERCDELARAAVKSRKGSGDARAVPVASRAAESRVVTSGSTAPRNLATNR
jgi:ribonuclease HI